MILLLVASALLLIWVLKIFASKKDDTQDPKIDATSTETEEHPPKFQDPDRATTLTHEEAPLIQKALPVRAVRQEPAKRFMGWNWKNIAFVDVETTGLGADDRIVTLAVILLAVPDILASDPTAKLDLNLMHRIYNPGKPCHPEAARIHGHSDWTLQHQPNFAADARDISVYVQRADLVVCHNAKFDLSFLGRELARASAPAIRTRSFCTMETYRRSHSGSASLDSVARHFGLQREQGRHGALEDAWLTLNIFFFLNGARAGFPFSSLSNEQRCLQNLRPVPQRTDRRTKNARHRSQLPLQ